MVFNLGYYAGVKRGVDNLTLYQLLQYEELLIEATSVKPLATVHHLKPAREKAGKAKYDANRLGLAIAMKARGFPLDAISKRVATIYFHKRTQ